MIKQEILISVIKIYEQLSYNLSYSYKSSQCGEVQIVQSFKDIYGNYRKSLNDMELIIAIPKITERKLRLIRNERCWF